MAGACPRSAARADAGAARPWRAARDAGPKPPRSTSKLNDAPRAQQLFVQVLAEDPSHSKAVDGAARIAERSGDFASLVVVLDRRAESLRGKDKRGVPSPAGRRPARLDNLPEASRRYEAVLAVEPHDLLAVTGLDRIYTRSGQIPGAPRQPRNASVDRRHPAPEDHAVRAHGAPPRGGVLERGARAAESLEQILAIDPTNEAAMSASPPRHYRQLEAHDKLARLYEQHLKTTRDDDRRAELLMNRGRLLAENLGAPDEAKAVYERVLELQPTNATALEAVAKLREQAGDAVAALSAIEALASQAATPAGRAEQWNRAARLLQGRGDLDGAIERYKLALEEDPSDGAASVALRRAYASRGELASVVALIDKELGLVERPYRPRASPGGACPRPVRRPPRRREGRGEREDGPRPRPDQRRSARRPRRPCVRRRAVRRVGEVPRFLVARASPLRRRRCAAHPHALPRRVHEERDRPPRLLHAGARRRRIPSLPP